MKNNKRAKAIPFTEEHLGALNALRFDQLNKQMFWENIYSYIAIACFLSFISFASIGVYTVWRHFHGN